jgi:anti-sigma B factor antagonist
MDHDTGPQLVHDVQRIGHLPPTSIRVVHVGGVSIVTLTGDHDLCTAPALRVSVDQELGAFRPCVIDLRGVTLLDSAILSVFSDAARLSRERGLEMPVVLNGNRGSGVRRLVKATMVTLRTFDDLTEAVAVAQPAVPA